MDFKRQDLLEPEVQEQLKDEMAEYWSAGLKGRQIAEVLEFGVPGSIYELIKPEYFYYFRQKFGLPRRNENPPFAQGEQRYKVLPDDLGLMSVEEFVDTLNKKLNFDSPYARKARSFLLMLYFSPLRVSEIYERVYAKEDKDFTISKDKITVHLLRKKKKHHKKKDEPINIPRVLPLVEELVQYLQNKEWKVEKEVEDENGEEKTVLNLRPWDISHDTARNFVKEVFPNHYPHFFRYNWISEEFDQPGATTLELKSKTMLTAGALEKYLITEKKAAERLDKRRIERYKELGVIK